MLGFISEGITRLNLSYINLSGNKIQGTIPLGLFLMPNIQEIDLSSNKFTGSFPTLDSAANIRESLVSLNVYDNLLSSTIPSWLMNATNLVYLNIQRNLFHGRLPDHVSLNQVKYLWMGMNALTGSLPKDMFHLNELEELAVHHNLFTGVLPKVHTSFLKKRELNLFLDTFLIF